MSYECLVNVLWMSYECLVNVLWMYYECLLKGLLRSANLGTVTHVHIPTTLLPHRIDVLIHSYFLFPIRKCKCDCETNMYVEDMYASCAFWMNEWIIFIVTLHESTAKFGGAPPWCLIKRTKNNYKQQPKNRNKQYIQYKYNSLCWIQNK